MFERYLKLDIVGVWVDEFRDDVFNVVFVRVFLEFYNSIFCYVKKRCLLNYLVVMFKKYVVFVVGGYMYFLFFEDYYFWVRMLINGVMFYNI